MTITISSQPCWLLEAFELVYGLVNHVSPERLTALGDFCIPPEEVTRIQELACRSISVDDEMVRFYFQGVGLKGDPNRTSCVAGCLLHSSYEVEHTEIDDMVLALSASWTRMRQEHYRITGINSFNLIQTPSSDEPVSTLYQDISSLPIPQTYQMQLLEALSAYDRHLRQAAELLRPVAEALRVLLAPWVVRTDAYVAQWTSFFEEHSVEGFLSQRGHLKVREIESVLIAMRYFSPSVAPCEVRNSVLRMHLGIALQPSMNAPSTTKELQEWELTALRLLANQPRLQMYHMMMSRSITAQDLARELNLNGGSVFRDLNSLSNARLICTQTIDGRNYYRADYQTLKQILQHFSAYLEET